MSFLKSARIQASIAYILPLIFPLPLLSLAVVLFYRSKLRPVNTFAAEHLAESANAQLSLHIYILLMAVFLFTSGLALEAGSLLLIFALLGLVVYTAWLVMMVSAIVLSLFGQPFRFPFNFRIFN
ncbi:uncharacterized protein DUF4870 [Salsuginibacillus halophilus]|uniref:Uncharacterized protein DUF4870 n=1 Tax=Salsuginibacillus halophilus TaxID=517424 RepID=A0A2P8HLH0_9BACI|nr:DUF4870 domain-containing protein [Salsuginibacillus halophilus]PSL47072.1 uncharacterized protein DUF4870 [Salsuginibacillus halophilus]